MGCWCTNGVNSKGAGAAMEQISHRNGTNSRTADGRPQDRRSVTALDIAIAARVRQARLASGLSQEELGQAIGVCWQQIYKYEVGTNRVAASRLYLISIHTKRPIGFFFENAEEANDAAH